METKIDQINSEDITEQDLLNQNLDLVEMEEKISWMPPEEVCKFIKEILNDTTKFDDRIVKHCLLLMSSYHINYELADTLCHKCLYHETYYVRMMAVWGAGYIAGTYEKLVNPNLYRSICQIYMNVKHPLYHEAKDALRDISNYLKIPKPMIPSNRGLDYLASSHEIPEITLCSKDFDNLSDVIMSLFDKEDGSIFLKNNELKLEFKYFCATLQFEEIKEGNI